MGRNRIAITLAAALVAYPALAQRPGEGTLAQERARIEAERKSMFAPGNPALSQVPKIAPSAQQLQLEQQRIERERKGMFADPSLMAAPSPAPNIPVPPRGQVDLEAIAKRYESKAQARKTEDLMIFASFSMPAESIKRMVASANRVGGAVVLRGFVGNSYQKTAAAILALGEAGGNVIVNPNAFTKYKIDAVPAVVLTKADAADQVDAEGCALPDTYASIAGDVSLDHALEELGRRAPQFQVQAGRYVRQLKGR